MIVAKRSKEEQEEERKKEGMTILTNTGSGFEKIS